MISKLSEIIKTECSLERNNTSNIDNVQNLFKLPISYIHDKYPIYKNIKFDLEINDSELSLYNYVFNPETKYANILLPLWSEYYTTNISFLNDSKNLIKNFKPINEEINIDKVDEILSELNSETGFYEKYKYLDSKYFDFLNSNPFFLQGLTMYNLTSPIMSLAIPIIMLIIPFFMIKFQKRNITITEYINALITVLKYHVIGKAISEFNDVGWDRRFFILISIIFYFINIYQNIISCYTFYKNIYKIREYLININNFLTYSIKSITNINKYCRTSYIGFVQKNEEIKNNLLVFNDKIASINLNIITIKQVSKIGNILNFFYELFKNKKYKDSIYYCLYLQGYIENLTCLQKNIKNKNINYCNFTRRSCRFKEAYFPPLINNNPIKNTYKLTKNIIITGPNAAGKTTLLKTTLFNILLSQQLGIGFYKSALVNPYKYIHSYINIPDTSGRDSLFQAEARRCKEILDSLSKSDNLERHFCIFDELYSGTNPTEAIASAYGFLKYISKFSNIDFMLTTHYFSLCNMMNKLPNISNKQMEILKDKTTYKIINGISNIKGGIKVLEELSYDDEIINSANHVIDNIYI